MKQRLIVRSSARIGSILLAGGLLLSLSQNAWAVVGRAERLDEFKEEDIKRFHKGLMREEKQSQMDQAVDILSKKIGLEGDKTGVYEAELEELKKQLLRVPKRDRIKFAVDGQWRYESNIHRHPPRKEKGDTVFDATGSIVFDLGGRKTDLSLETSGAKQWNIKYSNSDFLLFEERFRFRRKYFRKLTYSAQSRLARHSSRTIEIDTKKIRWDSYQSTSVNYAFSRKLSFNMEYNWHKRTFTAEAFDQDSDWQMEFAPSLFWQMTPKSRTFVGYRFGADRIRTKAGDANSQELHIGYFGRITRKSSMSLDFTVMHQSPRSVETPTVNGIKVGQGFIYQMTPKTQLTVQFIHSLQNTTSDLVSGTENETTKEDAYFVHDSFNVSLNSRLHRKITVTLNAGISHFRNKVARDADEDVETRQFTFPLSVTVNYMIRRFINLRLQYMFGFKTGDEKADTYRNHSFMSGLNLNF